MLKLYFYCPFRHFARVFDALHASVALSNNLTTVSNDEVYDKTGAKRISFKDFPNLLEK